MLVTSNLKAILALLFIVVNAHQISLKKSNAFSRPSIFKTATPYTPLNRNTGGYNVRTALQMKLPTSFPLATSTYRTRLFASVGTESEVKSPKPIKIIIAGAPAAGKGTQCEVIKEKFGVIHLSTGDMLRAAVKGKTELGLMAQSFMDAGQLVPDELIINVICERLKQEDCLKQGWLLDGFPRTKAQADALSAAGMVPDTFILLDVAEDVLVDRVCGRRTDPETGIIYHMTTKPPPADVVDRLVQRSDDTADKIKIRYKEFQNHAEEITSCYKDKMIWVDGAQDMSMVTQCVVSSLEKITPSVVVISEAPKFESTAIASGLKIIISGAPAAGMKCT